MIGHTPCVLLVQRSLNSLVIAQRSVSTVTQVIPLQKKIATDPTFPCSRQPTQVPNDHCIGSQVWISCKLLRLTSRTMAISAGRFISRLSHLGICSLTVREASLVAFNERTEFSQALPITLMPCLVVPRLQHPSHFRTGEHPPSIPRPQARPRSILVPPVPDPVASNDQFLPFPLLHQINTLFPPSNRRCVVSNELRPSLYQLLSLPPAP